MHLYLFRDQQWKENAGNLLVIEVKHLAKRDQRSYEESTNLTHIWWEAQKQLEINANVPTSLQDVKISNNLLVCVSVIKKC